MKQTTSFRLTDGQWHDLALAISAYRFKNKSHFYQLITEELIKLHRQKKRLDWPPHFATIKPQKPQ